jgi:hypothetical protein
MFRAALLAVCFALSAAGQLRNPEEGVSGLLRAFDSHRVIGLGEMRACKQQYEFYRALLASPQFSEKGIDIVVEFGNALYQPVVDRYLAGEAVPPSELATVWRNSTGLFIWDSAVYQQFFALAREVNLRLPKERRFRVLLGDPPVHWDQVRTREDLEPYIPHRHDHFANVLVTQVLAKNRKALAITGFFHMRMVPNSPSELEAGVEAASHEKMWVILAGSDVLGNYNDTDPHFPSWPRPGLLAVRDTWLGVRDAGPILDASKPDRFPGKFQEYADGYLYLGPRDSITKVHALRSLYEGTPYGREVARRLQMMYGIPLDFDKLPTSVVGTTAEGPYYQPGRK